MQQAKILIIAASLLLCILAGKLGSFLCSFLRERQILKMEIRRALSQRERAYWERELKILYLTCIPYVSRSTAKKILKKKKKK